MIIEFIVPGVPQLSGYENLVAVIASREMQGRPLLTGPIKLRICMVLPVPKSWTKSKHQAALKGELWPGNRPHIDSVTKAIFDALHGVVWRDKPQVCHASIIKTYGPRAGVAVLVRELGHAIDEGWLDEEF